MDKLKFNLFFFKTFYDTKQKFSNKIFENLII